MEKHKPPGESDNTKIKQDHLQRILHTLSPIWRSLITNPAHTGWIHPRPHGIDLNAGPGWYHHPEDLFGYPGSPLLLLGAARHAPVPLDSHVMDNQPQVLMTLQKHLIERAGMQQADGKPLSHLQSGDGNLTMHLYCGDTEQISRYSVIPALAAEQAYRRRKLCGVIYSDVNGNRPPFALLALYAATFPRLDILIHLSATGIKRIKKPHEPFLDEALGLIDKRYWLIREPYGAWQWSFAIGTNWQAFPVLNHLGFYPLTSVPGRAIMQRLSYPKKDHSR